MQIGLAETLTGRAITLIAGNVHTLPEACCPVVLIALNSRVGWRQLRFSGETSRRATTADAAWPSGGAARPYPNASVKAWLFPERIDQGCSSVAVGVRGPLLSGRRPRSHGSQRGGVPDAASGRQTASHSRRR